MYKELLVIPENENIQDDSSVEIGLHNGNVEIELNEPYNCCVHTFTPEEFDKFVNKLVEINQELRK